MFFDNWWNHRSVLYLQSFVVIIHIFHHIKVFFLQQKELIMDHKYIGEIQTYKSFTEEL